MTARVLGTVGELLRFPRPRLRDVIVLDTLLEWIGEYDVDGVTADYLVKLNELLAAHGLLIDDNDQVIAPTGRFYANSNTRLDAVAQGIGLDDPHDIDLYTLLWAALRRADRSVNIQRWHLPEDRQRPLGPMKVMIAVELGEHAGPQHRNDPPNTLTTPDVNAPSPAGSRSPQFSS